MSATTHLPPALFGFGRDAALVERVGHQLGIPRAQLEEREFEDGEHKSRPLESVRGRDVFVVASLHMEPGASVNDKLIRLLLFAGAVRDAGAARVTILAPYLAYARKDRRSKPRDPISTRYIAQLVEAVGVDRLVTLDVHNLAAFENAFRIPTVHLSAAAILVRALAPRLPAAPHPIAVVSPDAGAVKRADRFRELLEATIDRSVGFAVMEKTRSAGVVRSGALVGDLEGRAAILVDDLLASGTTLVRAAAACRARGATHVHAAVTHAVYTEVAAGNLDGGPGAGALDRIWITDTIPPDRYPPDFVARRLEVVDCAPLLAGAITRLRT